MPRMSDTFTTPDGRQVDINFLSEVYKSPNRFPIPYDARIHSHQEDSWQISVYSSLGNCDLMTTDRIEVQTELVERSSELRIRHVARPSLNTKTLIEDSSSSTRVLLSKGSGPTDYSITWFEEGKFRKSFNLSKRHETGPFLMAPLFCTFKLSPDARSVMYVAEKRRESSKSFFSQSKNPQADSDHQSVGDEHVLENDWGEGFVGIYSSVICILNLRNDSFQVISIDNVTLFEPFWITADEIGFLAIDELPRKLSFIFSFNRPTKLYSCSLDDSSDLSPQCLLGESDKVSLRSPRMSPDASSVVLLENPVFGPDMTSCKVILYNFTTEKKKIIVSNEASLYVYHLPEKCWNAEGTEIFFHSIHKCRSLLWQLDVDKCSLKRIRSPFASATFLTIDHGLAIIKSSCIKNMPQLFACLLDDPYLDASSWLPITPDHELKHVSYRIVEVKQKVHAILISPCELADKAGACIVLPHGGPHSASIDEYSPNYDRYTSLGFKVLLINYVGSIGYDDKTLRKLIGRVGKDDVEDCMSAISFLREKRLIDENQLCLLGHSYGGFLACHLALQQADQNWVALATKAPVIDLTSLAFSSDGPDFCWTVVLGKDYSPKHETIQPGLATQLFDASPIRWIRQLEAPSIVFVGTEDRCVPISSALAWHNILQDRGVATKCHLYPDGHLLRKINVDSDIFINTVIWFLTHLSSRLPRPS